MMFFGRARGCAVAIALCATLCGCFPPADNQSDETKEPHFLAGNGLVEQLDWPGALDEYQKSLEVNPHSASAHFQLGWLNEEKINPPDPAAAIYHYEQLLKLNPNFDKAELVRQRINNCKLDLVKNVSAGPIPSGAQKELERVAGENRELQNQIAQLQAQIVQLKEQLKAAAAAPRTVASTDPSPRPNRPTVTRSSPESSHTETSRNTTRSEQTSSTRTSHTVVGTKFHTVKSHETLASIARESGVSLAALEQANPQVRPTHLLVGQMLKVPSP